MRQKEDALGQKLDFSLGEENAKKICEDLALVLAKHGLVQSPEICKTLFLYMISVTEGWNSLYSGQVERSGQTIIRMEGS